MKIVLFWVCWFIGISLISKPYRESQTEIGLGFIISLVGFFTVLYYLAKFIFKKELNAGGNNKT